MSSHALLKAPAAVRPRLALGAAAAALLLLTAACSSDGAKDTACSVGATIDGWFGTTSPDRAKDCGGASGQSAKAYTGSPRRGEAPITDRATLSDLQSRLQDLGYDPGPADGQMGPKTRAAIRAYQKDSGLRADGTVTASLVKRIKTESR